MQPQPQSRQPNGEVRLLADALPQLIAFIDPQERHQFSNARYAEWSRAFRGNIEGRTILELVGETVYPNLKPHINAALDGCNVAFRTRMPHPAAGYSEMQIRYLAYTREQGQVLGFYCVMSELAEVGAVGSEKSRISHFYHAGFAKDKLSDLAHSLKQPLSAITNYVAVLQRMLQDNFDTDKARQVLAKVSDQTQSIDEMVTESRDAASAALMSHRAPLSLSKILEKCLSRADTKIAEQKAQVRVDSIGNLPFFYANEIQIEELVTNLIVNALEAMDDVAPERRQLTLKSCHDEEKVILAVRDTGRGIPAAKLGMLSTLRNSVHPGGRGLGLGICLSIVDNHDGQLWVESKPDEGTTFFISLPIDERSHQPRRST